MSILTTAGENYLAAKAAAQQVPIIVSFVYANIVGLDTDVVPPKSEVMPAAQYIVDEQPVSSVGYVNENQVVHSNILTNTMGGYDYNWVGLKTDDGTLLSVLYTPLQKKHKRNDTQIGDNQNWNFITEYTDLAELAQIDIAAESWQLDTTTRLEKIDSYSTYSLQDLFGEGAFIQDGFKVLKNNDNYKSNPGVAYIKGLRANLESSQTIEVDSFPGVIYVDAYYEYVSLERVIQFNIKSGSVLPSDYVDGSDAQHHIIKIASVAADGAVTDNRVVINSSPAAQVNASTSQAGVTKLNSSTDNGSETEAATPKAVKAVKDYFLENTTQTFASIDQLTSTDLKVGVTAKIRGENNDFLIVPGATGSTTTGKYFNLNNGNQAKRVIEGQVDTWAELLLTEPKFEGQKLELIGHTLPGIGGGVVVAKFNSAKTNDGGTIAQTPGGKVWERSTNGFVSLSMFGGVESALYLDIPKLYIDAAVEVTSDKTITTHLVEYGGWVTAKSGVNLSVLSYESNGKYFLRRETTDTIITGLYVNDSSMKAVGPKPGQPALKFKDGYVMGDPSGGYVNSWSSTTEWVPQERGEVFVRIKFKGALGQVRFEFKDHDGNVVKPVNVYPCGSESSFNEERTKIFNSDGLEKEIIIFSGTKLDVDGVLPRINILVHPSALYQNLEVNILEVELGYMNARHVERIPSRSPLGLKTISVREGGDNSLWFNDSNDSFIRGVVGEALKYNIDSVQIVMLFKAAINADLSINHTYFARFEQMLWWLSNQGVAINVSTNHNFSNFSEPDLIVYDDQILTAENRTALKNRMAGFVKLINQHPSVHVIEVQNEANLQFDNEAVVSTIATPYAFLTDMVDAVHENSDKLASISFSGGGRKSLFAVTDFGNDIIDMHAYDGIVTSTTRPFGKPIISSEHGSSVTGSNSGDFGLVDAQEYAETFGGWWKYITPGQAPYDSNLRTANALSVAGTYAPTIEGDTSVYTTSIQAGELAKTLGVTRMEDLTAESGEPYEFIYRQSTWINGPLVP